MIRRKAGGGWFLFTQDDHAKLSAKIMSFWGGEFFVPDSPDDLLFALSEHDCGWLETDSRPHLNKNGEPQDFTEVSPPVQTRIWRRSFRNRLEDRPRASALIALHFSKFNERTLLRKNNKWSLELRDEINNLTRQTFGAGKLPPDVCRELKLLQTGDAISLALCHGWESFEVNGVPLKNGEEKTVTLKMRSQNSYLVDPWPFIQRGRLIFETRFTLINRQKFDSEAELREDIKTRPAEKIVFSLLPRDL